MWSLLLYAVPPWRQQLSCDLAKGFSSEAELKGTSNHLLLISKRELLTDLSSFGSGTHHFIAVSSNELTQIQLNSGLTLHLFCGGKKIGPASVYPNASFTSYSHFSSPTEWHQGSRGKFLFPQIPFPPPFLGTKQCHRWADFPECLLSPQFCNPGLCRLGWSTL